ncbi:phosphonate C-P lyase system protein PhnG [Rhodococcus sp. HNM0569]|uniref:phosphonate C-P lyase system protein PhnG n=1 Tax=Rhodococcus sp. HNM0569 TaxID=2716340 RepID=UPI00146EA0F8|nr:phosphonate metabolism protein PhnG [Rhodococcus sp. HNM0569]
MTFAGLTRERVTELLARATEDELVEVADRVLADPALDDRAEFIVLTPPELGAISARVREPIAHDQFFLGDVLACRAEVSLAGERGWAIRLGDERAATLAAAICDAALHADRPAAPLVLDLCVRVEERLRTEDRDEWARIAPTTVRFEEL